MKLVLLGTGGYYANDRRQTACLIFPELGVLLDAGSGMCRLREYLATDRLDIFLTHAHLDHVIGLTYLPDVVPPDVLKRTTVHGDARKLAAIREHLFSEALFPIVPPFQAKPLGAPVALADGGTLTHFPLDHPGGSVGYRLNWPGRSLAYVTDTTASTDAKYIERIRGVNLLVHEAYFERADDAMIEVTGHSCLTEAARVAAAAQVDRLVLVHVNPQLARDSDLDLAPARQIFENVQLGADRMEIDF